MNQEKGRERRWSGDIKWGSPFRVERRSHGVSIKHGQLGSCSTPARPLPFPHLFAANFVLSIWMP
uniref:Uncharacterized protein n=1 Tax=Rhizophora mucronata TaxID=61149 RepID=A0A2P2P0G1_RHIMU